MSSSAELALSLSPPNGNGGLLSNGHLSQSVTSTEVLVPSVSAESGTLPLSQIYVDGHNNINTNNVNASFIAAAAAQLGSEWDSSVSTRPIPTEIPNNDVTDDTLIDPDLLASLNNDFTTSDPSSSSSLTSLPPHDSSITEVVRSAMATALSNGQVVSHGVPTDGVEGETKWRIRSPSVSPLPVRPPPDVPSYMNGTPTAKVQMLPHSSFAAPHHNIIPMPFNGYTSSPPTSIAAMNTSSSPSSSIMSSTSSMLTSIPVSFTYPIGHPSYGDYVSNNVILPARPIPSSPRIVSSPASTHAVSVSTSRVTTPKSNDRRSSHLRAQTDKHQRRSYQKNELESSPQSSSLRSPSVSASPTTPNSSGDVRRSNRAPRPKSIEGVTNDELRSYFIEQKHLMSPRSTLRTPPSSSSRRTPPSSTLTTPTIQNGHQFPATSLSFPSTPTATANTVMDSSSGLPSTPSILSDNNTTSSNIGVITMANVDTREDDKHEPTRLTGLIITSDKLNSIVSMDNNDPPSIDSIAIPYEPSEATKKRRLSELTNYDAIAKDRRKRANDRERRLRNRNDPNRNDSDDDNDDEVKHINKKATRNRRNSSTTASTRKRRTNTTTTRGGSRRRRSTKVDEDEESSSSSSSSDSDIAELVQHHRESGAPMTSRSRMRAAHELSANIKQPSPPPPPPAKRRPSIRRSRAQKTDSSNSSSTSSSSLSIALSTSASIDASQTSSSPPPSSSPSTTESASSTTPDSSLNGKNVTIKTTEPEDLTVNDAKLAASLRSRRSSARERKVRLFFEYLNFRPFM
jgi:hypothetical protein